MRPYNIIITLVVSLFTIATAQSPRFIPTELNAFKNILQCVKNKCLQNIVRVGHDGMGALTFIAKNNDRKVNNKVGRAIACCQIKYGKNTLLSSFFGESLIDEIIVIEHVDEAIANVDKYYGIVLDSVPDFYPLNWVGPPLCYPHHKKYGLEEYPMETGQL
jgi:hypothetical protein